MLFHTVQPNSLLECCISATIRPDLWFRCMRSCWCLSGERQTSRETLETRLGGKLLARRVLRIIPTKYHGLKQRTFCKRYPRVHPKSPPTTLDSIMRMRGRILVALSPQIKSPEQADNLRQHSSLITTFQHPLNSAKGACVSPAVKNHMSLFP